MIKTYRNVLNVKKYPKYKDSGIQWIGEIPEHWEVVRNKNIFSYKKVLNIENKEKCILSLTLKGVVENNPDNPEGLVPQDYSTYQIFEKNDLVFKLIDLENISTSRVGIVHKKGIMSPAYIRLSIKSLKDNDVKYFYYYFYSLYIQKVFNKLGAGVRATITPKELLDMKIPLPPLHEQQKIAEFLDKKTQLIDEYIKKKQKKIELLKELKKTIINDAVIGKINVQTGKPYSKYKPTGLKWLPKIPEHWEMRKLKYVVKGKLQYGANHSGIEYKPNLPRYIRITDFDTNGNLREDTKLSLPKDIAKDFMLKEGDILFARSGATVGKSFFCKNLKEPSCFAGYLIKARPKPQIIYPEFLYLFTQSFTYENWKNFIFNKATIENIGADKYSILQIPLPPLEEQQKIAQFLDKKIQQIDQLIQKTEKEIKLIKEFKEKLISDAVLGRIKVF